MPESETTTELVTRLDAELRTRRPSYYALLRAGASDSQLDDLEKILPCKLPESFRDLYRWRNGQEDPYEILYVNRSMLPVEEIIDFKQILDGMIGSDFEDPRHWRRGWVPFLENGGGSHLCLDLLAEDGGDRNQLIAFWKADADRPIEYPNLDAWIRDVIKTLVSDSGA